ncbi:hypothetical protein TNCV_1640811 [Trichonephila clavipes]|nr:hypothetical protein TNCV_1640811 [Trichonephila clavipes]
MMRTTRKLAPPSPNYDTTPTGGCLSSRPFNVHRCPTRRVFSGTGLELMTCLPRSDTLTTGLPQPPQACLKTELHSFTAVSSPRD